MITRLISLAALGLIACAACANEPPATTRRPPVREYELQAPEPTTKRNDPLPQALRAALQADAMKRAGVAAGQLAVVSSEKVTWSDGALGCPQPGRMYTQSLVPGYRVWMRAGERLLVYHAAESGELVLCPTAARRVAPDAPVAE